VLTVLGENLSFALLRNSDRVKIFCLACSSKHPTQHPTPSPRVRVRGSRFEIDALTITSFVLN